MDFQLTTKTPIVTGGIDPRRGTETVRETGIMGSLRWWYEALVRGAGGNGCDPTNAPDGCRCDACTVFGSTAGARKFSLMVDDSGMQNAPPQEVRVQIGDGRGWRLPQGKMGRMRLSIHGMRGNRGLERHLGVLLQLMANWGGFGAKTYLGYGVFGLSVDGDDNISEADVDNLIDSISDSRSRGVPEPSLSRMFFSKITLNLSQSYLLDEVDGIRQSDFNACKNAGFLPTAPHVRLNLRAMFRDEQWVLQSLADVDAAQLKDLRHYTIGVLRMQDRLRRRQGNQGAKIAASHLYPLRKREGLWQMRVWGYVPQHALPQGVTDAQIIADLQRELSDPDFFKDVFDDDNLQLASIDFRQQGSTDFLAFLKGLTIDD